MIFTSCLSNRTAGVSIVCCGAGCAERYHEITVTNFVVVPLQIDKYLDMKIIAGIPPSPTSKDATAPKKDISPDVGGIKVDAEKKLESWGKPMGLPSPKRPSSPTKKHSSASRKKAVSSSSSPVPPVYMDLVRIFHTELELGIRTVVSSLVINRDKTTVSCVVD